MEIVDFWTGRKATALRNALRLTNEGFAEMLGTAVRTTTKWSTEPDLVPYTELQRALDTVLSQATSDARARFVLLSSEQETLNRVVSTNLSQQTSNDHDRLTANAELRLGHDPNIHDILDWLDVHAEWQPGEARVRVAELLHRADPQSVQDTNRGRGRIGRAAIAGALADFYAIGATDANLYRIPGNPSITTSVLTRPEWLDLGLILGKGNDHIKLRPNTEPSDDRLDESGAQAATRRIAEILATDTRLVNRPLYRLMNINITPNSLTGQVSLMEFGSYALTMDLLETELLDAIVTQQPITPKTLPLRNQYLPTIYSATNFEGRICAGGPLALFAAARPGNRRRSTPDYVLLVQERSGQVLNATRRLAVIPKSFHEPLIDFSDDAQISATLEREMEEELFGRRDVDEAPGKRRLADPLNANHLSEPMRWLIDRTDTSDWRIECTGFGINLVSGNFEFASLIVIDNEDWWGRFGGQVEANWESEGLRRYSTYDHEGLLNLITEPGWSNEGLFAFSQGLRRLAETNNERVSSALAGKDV